MTQTIVQLLQDRCGIDLTGYRPATLERRIRNRMLGAGLASLEAYAHLLATSETEAPRLLERIAIKVSRFYRNAAVFDALRTQVLPHLAQRHGRVRAWSAGCAHGEEAYTIAMLLDAANIPGEVIATDLDPAALTIAMRATYTEAALKELPLALKERYFVAEGAAWGIVPAIRHRVRFGLHDLGKGQPAGGAGASELVACRNVLIYWTQDVQRRMLQSVTAATVPGGALMLGESEWPFGEVATRLREWPGCDRIFQRIDVRSGME